VKRSQWGSVLAGVVVVAAGFAIGVVEFLRFPKGTVWLVVAAAVALVALIRFASGR
jgi:hypothetical protein